MLQTIIEYTGFFLMVIFAFGIAAAILFAIWDEFQATRIQLLNSLRNRPMNILKGIKNQLTFKYSNRVKRSGV